MVRRMAFFHGNENSTARGANFSSSSQCSFDGRTVVSDLNNPGGEIHGVVRRCRSHHLDGVFRSNCAGRAIFTCVFHQMVSRRPVAMTIE